MRGTKKILEVKWKDKWYTVHEEYENFYLVSSFNEKGVGMFSVLKIESQELREK